MLSKADSIGFAAKITATLGVSLAIQSKLTQRRIADSLSGIAKDISIIAQRAEIENNSNLAGNRGEINVHLHICSPFINLQDSLFKSSILQTKSQQNVNHALSLPTTPATSQTPVFTTSSSTRAHDGNTSTLKPASSGSTTTGDPLLRT